MSVAEALVPVRERVRAACARAGRDPAGVCLRGVSKFHDRSRIEEAWQAGIRVFGESRVREAAEKFEGFRESRPGAILRMIGSLQRNKARTAAALFDGIDSVDREELIAELGSLCVGRGPGLSPGLEPGLPLRPGLPPGSRLGLPPLPILLELNAGEASKSGFSDEDALFRAAEKALAYPGLALRGLMTMAPLTDDAGSIRRAFRALVRARDNLQIRFPEADWSCLSMGMSGDFEIAIEEGSTLIRIGTALFGERKP
jgi:uncharacterized pyridoxal phosphate-containing UPF0001 family protein